MVFLNAQDSVMVIIKHQFFVIGSICPGVIAIHRLWFKIIISDGVVYGLITRDYFDGFIFYIFLLPFALIYFVVQMFCIDKL